MANNNRQRSSEGPSRRSLLKSMGAGSAGLTATPSLASLADVQILGSATASTDGDDASNRSLLIESAGKVEYEFAVTGLLSEVDAPSDAVEMGAGSGTLVNESHEFSFTGEFTALDIEGDATVTVDGEVFDYETFPHNTLKIITDDTVDYDVSASGAVEIESGDAERPTDRRVTGTINNVTDSNQGLNPIRSSHTLSYTGELTYLDINGDAKVIDNGTVVDPNQPLPSIESSQAKIRSLGGTQEYNLHLGWDAAVQSKHDTVDNIDQGIVRGTTTPKSDTFLFNGVCQFIEVLGIGTIRNHPTTDKLEVISEGKNPISFTIVTSNEKKKEFTLDPDESKTPELSGQITKIRMESDSKSDSEGIQLDIKPSTTADTAKQVKRLHLAAKLEREPMFAPLATHAEAKDGRIRMDSAGISVLHFLDDGDPKDPLLKDSYIAARFKLTDINGKDRASIELAKNTRTGEVRKAQLHYHHRTEENVPESVEVGELVVKNSEKDQRVTTQSTALENHEQIITENTHTSEITNYTQNQAAASEGTVLRTVKLKYEQEDNLSQQSMPLFPCEVDWVPCDDAREAYEEGAKEIGRSADWLKDKTTDVIDAGEDTLEVIYDGSETGMSVIMSSTSAVVSWGYQLEHFTGFTDRGAAAFNNTVTVSELFVQFATSLANNGQITSCSGCIAIARAAMDYGVGKASMLLCTTTSALTGGVGGLTCSVFFSVLLDLLADNTEEAAAQEGCEIASLC